MKTEALSVITERLIAALEAGVVPWRRPWSKGRSAPANLVSGRNYTEFINLWLLSLSSFKSPFWLTRRQALKLEGKILEGEKPTPVVSIWWRKVEVDNQPGIFRFVPSSRLRWVFNYEQCRGLKKNPTVTKTFVHDPLTAAEALVTAMPDPPAIKEGGDWTGYDLFQDLVRIPPPKRFKRRVDYYAALFHELSHSTGHKRRLNRSTLEGSAFGGWGGQERGQEELIAEMTASFLCGKAGILDQTLDNSAAYLECWLKALRGDHRLLFTAASQAQKAADYILGRLPSRGVPDAIGCLKVPSAAGAFGLALAPLRLHHLDFPAPPIYK